MSWGRLDDDLWCHRKVTALEAHGPHVFAQATSLWLLANSYCRKHAPTTGEVTLAQLRRIVPYSPVRGSKALVAVGLWDVTEQGFKFNDWEEYLPSRRNKSPSKSTTTRLTSPPTSREQVPQQVGNKSPMESMYDTAKSLKKKPIPEPDPDPTTPSGVERARKPPLKVEPRRRSGFVAWYAKMWERHTGQAYLSAARHETDFAAIDAWLFERSVDPADGLRALKAGILADAHIRSQGYPPRLIASQIDQLVAKGASVLAERRRAQPRQRSRFERLTTGEYHDDGSPVLEWVDHVEASSWLDGSEPPGASQRAFAEWQRGQRHAG